MSWNDTGSLQPLLITIEMLRLMEPDTFALLLLVRVSVGYRERSDAYLHARMHMHKRPRLSAAFARESLKMRLDWIKVKYSTFQCMLYVFK